MKKILTVTGAFLAAVHSAFAAPLFTLGSGDYYGFSVSVVGDLNRDGFNDILIGDPQAREQPLPPPRSPDEVKPGKGFLMSGRDGVQLFGYTGFSHNDRFGWSTAGLGDVDGDGIEDLLFGAPAVATGRPGYARVYTRRASFTVNGSENDDLFGYDVASLGDIDNDHFDDFVVGVPGAHDAAGALRIYSGNALVHGTTTPLLELTVPGSHGLGSDVAGRGDLNGDGYPDLVSGSWNNHLYVFYGTATGFDPTPVDIAMNAFVASVEIVGDLNGDGIDDLVASSEVESSVFFYLGGLTGVATTPIVLAPPATLSIDQHYIGYSLSKARDFDCNGTADLLIGVPLSEAGKAHRFSYDSTAHSLMLQGAAGDFAGSGIGAQFGFSLSAGWMGGFESSSVVVIGEPMTGGGRADVYRFECGGVPTPTPTPNPSPTPTSDPTPTPGSGSTAAREPGHATLKQPTTGCTQQASIAGQIDFGILMLVYLIGAMTLHRRRKDRF